MRRTHKKYSGIRWGLLFGWGVAIYSVMFFAWSTLVIHGYVEGMMPRILLTAILVFVSSVAGRSLRHHRAIDILPYSIGWVIIAVLFDAASAVPVSGWEIYADWNIWVGYLILLTVPLLAPFTRGMPEPARIT